MKHVLFSIRTRVYRSMLAAATLGAIIACACTTAPKPEKRRTRAENVATPVATKSAASTKPVADDPPERVVHGGGYGVTVVPAAPGASSALRASGTGGAGGAAPTEPSKAPEPTADPNDPAAGIHDATLAKLLRKASETSPRADGSTADQATAMHNAASEQERAHLAEQVKQIEALTEKFKQAQEERMKALDEVAPSEQ